MQKINRLLFSTLLNSRRKETKMKKVVRINLNKIIMRIITFSWVQLLSGFTNLRYIWMLCAYIKSGFHLLCKKTACNVTILH